MSTSGLVAPAWWDVPVEITKTARPVTESVPKPESKSKDGSFRFHSITIDVSSYETDGGIVWNGDATSATAVLDLKDFTGTIKLTKGMPQSRFTSSFNTTVDERIPKPFVASADIPSWMDATLSSSNKRKESPYEYEHMIAPKMAKITTPLPATASGAGPVADIESITALPLRLSRSAHVTWKLKGGGIAVQGGSGSGSEIDSTGSSIRGDLVHIVPVPDSSQSQSKFIAKRQLCDQQARSGHTATTLPGQELVLLFGGHIPTPTPTPGPLSADGEADEDCCADSLLILDTNLDIYYPPAVSGKGPSARSEHAAGVLLEGRAVVFYGGITANGKYPHNIHWLDTTRWHWNSPKCDGKPPRARCGHCCHARDENTLLYFGGNDDVDCFNDVHLLKCTEKRIGSGTCSWQWEQPLEGQIKLGRGTKAGPVGRSNFASCVIGNGRYLFIRGGWYYSSSNSSSSNKDGIEHCLDSYVLDMRDMVWHEIPPSVSASIVSVDSTSVECGVGLGVEKEVEARAENDAGVISTQGKVAESAIVVQDNILLDDIILLFGGVDLTGIPSKAVTRINVASILKSLC